MEQKRKVFFISPVRQTPPPYVQLRIGTYVWGLEAQGYAVHWPVRDTKQDAPALDICLQNAQALREADEVHIWYDAASQGSIFDLGAAVMSLLVVGPPKQFIIANPDGVKPTSGKSIPNLVLALVAESKARCNRWRV